MVYYYVLMKKIILTLLGIFALSSCSSTQQFVSNSSQSISETTISGVKRFEGFFSRPYVCKGGKKTIGYGLTGKVANRSRITPEEADKLLRVELAESRANVLSQVVVPLKPYQLDALTSFEFNTGPGNLKQLVSGPGRLNSGNYSSVEILLPQYRKARGKILLGLERRRQWELQLWRGKI